MTHPRQTPELMRARYFCQDGHVFVLDDKVRQMVVFEDRSLLDHAPSFWAANSFDVIFCRNVIMYFPVEVQQEVVARFAASLAPGGYLFLGHTENLRSMSSEFELQHTHDTFYYQKAFPAARAATIAMAQIGTAAASTPPAPAAPPVFSAVPELDNDAWMETIRRAGEQIAKHRRSAAGAPCDRTDAAARASTWDTAPVMEMLGNEQFAKALAHLDEFPDQANSDPDAMLLRAVALTNKADCDQAETVLAALLVMDEFNPAAHHLLALCREQAHDDAQARSHDEIAIYLDPRFAIAHFHLGRLARREGDAGTARREFRQAIELGADRPASRGLLRNCG